MKPYFPGPGCLCCICIISRNALIEGSSGCSQDFSFFSCKQIYGNCPTSQNQCDDLIMSFRHDIILYLAVDAMVVFANAPMAYLVSDSANPHDVSDPLLRPLWDHCSTGQLRTLIPRGYLKYCEVSRLRQLILV